MTLDEAKAMIASGTKFGDVYPFLDDVDRDGQSLKDYFCFHSRQVHLNGKSQAKPKKPSEGTGDVCNRCGGLMVRTGTCLTCQDCGESSGGCG